MKLSVITINRNNASGLRKTIESVVNQTFHDFEYIVIDGASDDGSVDVIKEFADKITYWVSEPDGGIYSAMNKGVRKAQGEYVQFLNSGDYYVGDLVLTNLFKNDFGEDVVYCNQINVYASGNVHNCGYASSNLSFLDVYDGKIHHSSSFSKRYLFEKYGYFDESYKIIADYVFFVKVLGYGNATVRYINQDVSVFDGVSGVSSQKSGKWKQIHDEEDNRVFAELYSPRLRQFCEESRQSFVLFHALKRYKLIWWLTLLLRKTSNLISKIGGKND